MTNRKMDFGTFWVLGQKCRKALCESNEKLKNSFESAQKYFARKTKPEEAIKWADEQEKLIGDFVEVPIIGKPLQKIF